jgi:hypothetical protein
VPGVPGRASAWPSFGERAASRLTVSVTYHQAVAVPTPNPAAGSSNVSPLRRRPGPVAACVQQIADSRTRPPQDTEDMLTQLERDGLAESAAALRVG